MVSHSTTVASTIDERPTVRLPEPIIHIVLEEAAFCTLDWGNSELIAAGLANGNRPCNFDKACPLAEATAGVIVVYNIGRALRSPSEREPLLHLIAVG
jgi:hypothetical protein